MDIFTPPLGVHLIVQHLSVPRIVETVEALFLCPFCYSYWAIAWTRGRLSCVYGASVVLRGTPVVWGTLDAMKHRWYLLYPCVYFPLLLYQKEGEKKAPSFPFRFSILLGAECRGQCWCKLIGIRIDVAGPRARVTCASSGS